MNFNNVLYQMQIIYSGMPYIYVRFRKAFSYMTVSLDIGLLLKIMRRKRKQYE